MLYKKVQKIVKNILVLGLIAIPMLALTPSVYADTVNNVSEPGATSQYDCSSTTGLNRDNCGIVRYLIIFINLLSAMVGIVVTGVIIVGGIQYSTSAGDPSKVQAAKKRIYNGVLSVVVFIFAYAFLQWVVPGGALHIK